MPLGKPLQLLHVDDSATLRKTVERGLEPFKDDYHLVQASSVDEAVSLLVSGKKFDIILTDWLMNGKSGLDLLKYLKSHPTYHHLPVFFLTSEYDSTSLVTAVAYGAGGILKKPATGPEIHAYLQKRQPYIDESIVLTDHSYLTEMKSALTSLRQVLPFKGQPELAQGLQSVQKIFALAKNNRWPILADYSKKIEDVLQSSMKKGGGLTPLSVLFKDYFIFMNQAVTEIENGKQHLQVPEEIEANLKSYQKNLEAGWFGGGEEAKPAASAASVNDGVVISWDMISELQRHLSPKGLSILNQYLEEKKKK